MAARVESARLRAPARRATRPAACANLNKGTRAGPSSKHGGRPRRILGTRPAPHGPDAQCLRWAQSRVGRGPAPSRAPDCSAGPTAGVSNRAPSFAEAGSLFRIRRAARDTGWTRTAPLAARAPAAQPADSLPQAAAAHGGALGTRGAWRRSPKRAGLGPRAARPAFSP